MKDMREIIVPCAPLCRQPDLDRGIETQLLFGEAFAVTANRGGWCEGISERDGYAGYVPRAALGPHGPAPTHKVGVLRTPVFRDPDHKSSSEMMLSFQSLVRVVDQIGAFVRILNLGWVASAHLVPVNVLEKDHVEVARRFIGTPYLWGGRTSMGVDCSGLVQLAMQAVGRACPRNSASQQRLLGKPLDGGVKAEAKRGDLLFLPGHVAIFTGPERVVNAHAGEGKHFMTFEQDLHELLTDFTQTERENAVIHRLTDE